jgi:hypothetical protein
MAANTTFKKREKERVRMERRREKELKRKTRRETRNGETSTSPVSQESVDAPDRTADPEAHAPDAATHHPTTAEASVALRVAR